MSDILEDIFTDSSVSAKQERQSTILQLQSNTLAYTDNDRLDLDDFEAALQGI